MKQRLTNDFDPAHVTGLLSLTVFSLHQLASRFIPKEHIIYQYIPKNTRYVPLRKSLPVIANVLGCIALAVVFSGKCKAAETPLAELYRTFLANGNASVFVTFERETIIPKKQVGQQEIDLSNGRSIQINLWNKDYFAFYRNGSNFIVAYSSKAPITGENIFNSADELNGFDGDSYWILGLDKPITLHIGSTNNPNLPALLSFNPLTIIPLTEAMRSQGKFQSDIKLARIKGVVAECLSVTQFGCVQALDSAPSLKGNQLSLAIIGKPTVEVEAKGGLEHPAELDYGNVTDRVKLQVSLDYPGSSLTVQRSSEGKVFFQTRYRILATQSPCPRDDQSFFSWRSYKENAGNVIGMIMTNGATVEAVFSNNSTAFNLGSVMGRPISNKQRNNQQGNVRRWLVFLLFMIASIGGLFLIWIANKSKTKNQKQTMN